VSHAGKSSVQHEQHHAAVLYHAAGLCAAPHRFSERCVRGRGYVLFCFVVTLGSIATPSCYVMAKQMGHEGVLTGSVCVTTTLFSAFSLTFWLFLLRSMGCIA
jgi:pyridoxal biosynthesis lyase PdxS